VVVWLSILNTVHLLRQRQPTTRVWDLQIVPAWRTTLCGEGAVKLPMPAANVRHVDTKQGPCCRPQSTSHILLLAMLLSADGIRFHYASMHCRVAVLLSGSNTLSVHQLLHSHGRQRAIGVNAGAAGAGPSASREERKAGKKAARKEAKKEARRDGHRRYATKLQNMDMGQLERELYWPVVSLSAVWCPEMVAVVCKGRRLLAWLGGKEWYAQHHTWTPWTELVAGVLEVAKGGGTCSQEAQQLLQEVSLRNLRDGCVSHRGSAG
jgi:hypothetical protein